MKCPYHPHLDMYVSMSAADNLYACQDTTCTYRGGVTLETIQHDRRMFLGEPGVTQPGDDGNVHLTLNVLISKRTPSVESLIEMLKSGDGELMEIAMQSLGVFLGLNMATMQVWSSNDPKPDLTHSPDFLAKPHYWEGLTGIRIINPDGWRGPMPPAKSYDEPITQAEFKKRAGLSTAERPTRNP